MRARLAPSLLTLVVVLYCVGLWNGYSRGGQDFRVFDFAARTALEGRWSTLYLEGPDRFLYAPGFAILFAPLSLFSQPVTHALWMLLLSTAFFLSMRLLTRAYGLIPVCIAILFSMRSIWIDLRYGQVNLLILASAVWALFTFANSRSNKWIFISWVTLGVAAVSKIYPLALLVVPLFAGVQIGRDRVRGCALLGASVGMLFVLILPFLFSGGSGVFLIHGWIDALGRRGFPTDTHNQSFLAFLYRFFSGESFYSLTLGGTPLNANIRILSPPVHYSLWIFFSGIISVLFLRSIYKPRTPNDAYSLAIAVCFLPAHLIWKSYFLLGIPLLASLVSRRVLLPVLFLGAGLALTSNEFLSPRASAWVEASGVFLWVHIAIIGCALYLEASPKSSKEFSS